MSVTLRQSTDLFDDLARRIGGHGTCFCFKPLGPDEADFINSALNYYMKRYFSPGEPVVHAGCGGGQVDVDVVKRLKVTALDISAVALERYRALARPA